ncbi:MAG: S1 RNA-binding domain-containing protein [Patescibacteria group bacterium]
MSTATATKTDELDLKTLLSDKTYLNIPKVGDVIKGSVITVSKNEVRIDISGYRTGVVRGREVLDESQDYAEIATGSEVEATVVELENENGEVELSFRFAGHQKAWEKLEELRRSGEIIKGKIIEANKGGLLVKVSNVNGFLPVSQLSPDHYPRVAGGDKAKILEKLKSFVGQDLEVKVFDVNESEEKLIVSEKVVWEERQKNVIAKYKVGDTVEGDVTALADFGAFVRFDNLEGLVHISEIAWQRIDHPRDILKVGDKVKAEVIDIEGSKIFLSIKKLINDPWKNVGDKYKVGQTVKGKVLKVNPFGFFVELDPDIHGLAHVSELSKNPVANITDIAKPGDEMEFMVVSVEPEQHRLGLSRKALQEQTSKDDKAEPEDKKEEEKTDKA